LAAGWRRADRPESQLTEAAATALLTAGRSTPRDLTVLRAVWMYGVMTADQITRLVFHPLADASAKVISRRRLNFLYEEHCLNRVWRGRGHDFVYTLDVQGARLIQLEQQRHRRKEVPWSAQAIREKFRWLDHHLDITDFGLNLTLLARTGEGGGGLRWYGEHTLTLTTKTGDPLNPAGLGLLRLGEARASFFLEWDHDVEAVAVVGSKIENYVDFLRSPEIWRSQFTRFPVVLVAMTTPARAEDLGIAVGQRLTSWLAAGECLTVLVTTHARLQEHGVLGPVWFQAGATDQREGLALPDLMQPSHR
jgi:hypothetical protein